MPSRCKYLHGLSQPLPCVLSSVLELEDNEAAVSLCLLRFSSYPDEGLMLAVGTVQGLTFYPRQVDGALSCIGQQGGLHIRVHGSRSSCMHCMQGLQHSAEELRHF